MTTPWQRARATRSQIQEERFGKSVGARPQVNSGRLWWSKRDNRKFDFLVENRTTENDSYSVKGKELKKIASDAIFHNSLPALNIEFSNLHEDWILVRTSDLEAMTIRLAELEALAEDLLNRDED